MPNDQWRCVAMILRSPFVNQRRNRVRDVSLAGAGVDQKALVFTEQQVQEGLLVVYAPALSQNEEVGIVLVNLPLGSLHAVRAAGSPCLGERASADAAAVRLGGLPDQNAQGQYRQKS